MDLNIGRSPRLSVRLGLILKLRGAKLRESFCNELHFPPITLESVRLNINQPGSGQALSTKQDARPRYTGERLLRERPKIYRQVVRLLGEGWSANKICKLCHVTRETVRAVEKREAVEISERKRSIVGILGNVAELGAARMEETIGKAKLRDAAIGTGIAVDKILALTGQMPVIAVQINLPTAEERAQLDRDDELLDKVAARLCQDSVE